MNKLLIEQYKKIHSQLPYYGDSSDGGKWHDHVLSIASKFNCKKILDFGCGKGKFVLKLKNNGYEAVGYDPALEEFSTFPSGEFDMVISTDVFEHLEEDTLNEELNQILQKNPNIIYLNIATMEARHILPNGTNCHTLVKNEAWWLDKISTFFDNYEIIEHKITGGNMPSVIIILKIK